MHDPFGVASSARTMTQSAVLIIILGGYNGGLRASVLAERIRAVKSIVDRELTERLPHHGPKFSHEKYFLGHLTESPEKCFFVLKINYSRTS